MISIYGTPVDNDRPACVMSIRLPVADTVALEKVIELPLTLIPKTRLLDTVRVPATVAAEPVSRSRPCTPLRFAVTPERIALEAVCRETPNTKLSWEFTLVKVKWAPLTPI